MAALKELVKNFIKR